MGLPQGLVARLLIAQLAVVGVAGLALVATAAVVGPRLFTEHLRHTGESSPIVIQHAEEAFASSFAIALSVSLLMALITAGLVALLVVRRIAGSVTALAAINDTERRVTVVLDKWLAEQELVNCHPLTNSATTTLRTADLIRFLVDVGHPPRLVALDQAEAPA